MVTHTIKILQHLLQDFKSVPDHFGKLHIKSLNKLTGKNIARLECSTTANYNEIPF